MGSETKYTLYTQEGTPICEVPELSDLGSIDDRNECIVPVLNQQTFEHTLHMKKRDMRKLRRLWNGLKPRKEATKKERFEKARKKHRGRTDED